ncbi:MAG: 3-isopropylmalate dehydratase large subunit [Rectinemataceae bacterium]
MSRNLFDKVWESHRVGALPTGQDQLFIGLHLIHEVTSPQAFGMIAERGMKVLYPGRSFATADHIVPTTSRKRPFEDPEAEAMLVELERNVKLHGIKFFDFASGRQGVVHVVGPELGLTQPGMTIACGDSHTATHGAFGAIAFGIGTSQVRDVLATQTLALDRPRVRKIDVRGSLGTGVGAKDLILYIMAELGVEGGLGYAYEYTGEAVRSLSMEGRMTLCNMSIEGGARSGYVSPDATTYEYLKGRPHSPGAADWDRAVSWWQSLASGADASFDDEKVMDANVIEPMVTWGINPGQGLGVGARMPRLADLPPERREGARKAYDYMGLAEGAPIAGTKIDVAFIGSCTNGRIEDLRAAAAVAKGRKVAKGIRALVVPGSMQVDAAARAEGLDRLFTEAGFEYREPGCSMCLAMNPDKLKGREVSASSSNRNFIGRQGSPTGRTLLMSPTMVAAAALAGEVVDSRSF